MKTMLLTEPLAVVVEEHSGRERHVLRAVHTYLFPSRVLLGRTEEFIGELERCSSVFRSAEHRLQGRGA